MRLTDNQIATIALAIREPRARPARDRALLAALEELQELRAWQRRVVESLGAPCVCGELCTDGPEGDQTLACVEMRALFDEVKP